MKNNTGKITAYLDGYECEIRLHNRRITAIKHIHPIDKTVTFNIRLESASIKKRKKVYNHINYKKGRYQSLEFNISAEALQALFTMLDKAEEHQKNTFNQHEK